MASKQSYSLSMLPNVNYKLLEDDGFIDELLDLEYETMENLRNFVEELREILAHKKIYLTSELAVAHLCAYLGFFTLAGIGIRKATQLEPKIKKLLESQAIQAYNSFLKYPVNSTVENQKSKKENIHALREKAPGSIIVQTVRLGRVVFDMIQELRINRPMNLYPCYRKQPDFFCPPDEFMKLLKKTTSRNIKEWKKRRYPESILYPINHATVQIGWLMGYYAHLDQGPPVNYLEYGAPCIMLYIEYGQKFLKIK